MEVFQNYAYYYNAFYQDKDYEAEAKTVDRLLKTYNCQAKNIINFGCGTGRHDIELTKLGYCCKGIDLSPLMIDIAVQQAKLSKKNIEYEVADVRDYKTDRKYNAAVSLFHVMSYQTTNEDLRKAFKSIKSTLIDKDGYFLFDAWYGPGVLSDKPCVRVKEVEDAENKLIRIARPIMYDKRNVVDVNYEVLILNKMTGKVQTVSEVHSMRYFFRPELEILLEEAGFELVENVDCQTLGETDYNSWTSYFIAKTI